MDKYKIFNWSTTWSEQEIKIVGGLNKEETKKEFVTDMSLPAIVNEPVVIIGILLNWIKSF